MATQKEMRRAFRDGEDVGLRNVNEIVKRIRKEFTHDQQPSMMSAFMTGYAGAILFYTHQELVEGLKRFKEKPEPADRWIQMVIGTLQEAFLREKIPIKCSFIIAREGGSRGKAGGQEE